MSRAGDFLRDHARHRRILSRHAHAAAGVMPPRHTYRFLVLLALGSLVLANIRFLGPERVDDVIPTWSILLWSALLVIGSIFTLAATTWHDRVVGMLVERAGHTAISTACLSYGASIILATGTERAPSYLLLVAGLASAFRAIRVHKELRTLRDFMRTISDYKEAVA